MKIPLLVVVFDISMLLQVGFLQRMPMTVSRPHSQHLADVSCEGRMVGPGSVVCLRVLA